MSDDRSWPAAIPAERALLGGLILDPSQIPEVESVIAPWDFYRPEHQRLFGLLAKMRRDGEQIDLVTLGERVAHQADKYGGVSYVLELPEQIPSTANLLHYAGVVADRAFRRDLLRAAHKAIERAHTAEVAQGALDALTVDVAKLRVPGRRKATTLGECFDEFVDDAERMASSDYTPWTPTDYRDLDQILSGGLWPGDLNILAARPSMGKTALALNILVKVAQRGEPTGLLSLEMTRQQLTQRMVAQWTGIPLTTIRNPKTWSQEIWDKVMDARDALHRLPLLVEHRPGCSVEAARAEVTRWKLEHPKLKVVVLDYLGLMPAPLGLKQEATGRNAEGMKRLAGELGISLVLIHQLNRGLEKRDDKRPIMSDLRDSGEIEQHADGVWFVHRPSYFDRSQDQRLAEVIVAKQRMGERGRAVNLEWWGEVQLFCDWPTLEERRAAAADQQRPRPADDPEPDPVQESLLKT